MLRKAVDCSETSSGRSENLLKICHSRQLHITIPLPFFSNFMVNASTHIKSYTSPFFSSIPERTSTHALKVAPHSKACVASRNHYSDAKNRPGNGDLKTSTTPSWIILYFRKSLIKASALVEPMIPTTVLSSSASDIDRCSWTTTFPAFLRTEKNLLAKLFCFRKPSIRSLSSMYLNLCITSSFALGPKISQQMHSSKVLEISLAVIMLSISTKALT